MPDDRRCTQLADYVTSTWIEGDFSQASWNHLTPDDPRTNNTLEGWHNRVKKLVCKAHPNIYELIQFLKMEQTTTETRYLQYDAGQRRSPKRWKYRDLDNRLDQLKMRLQDNFAVLEYADAAAHLLSL
ncbi:uncharacterized protein LOC124262952 [Haliotis rubra]|uniref:uncharacterized protein LOC124262952 n=1 Tax=Haliotis rubra TaxID=36100 RepID=UPI001EE5236F|nr:uncharacterized protein LOC124262952 [Haliotis rubra]